MKKLIKNFLVLAVFSKSEKYNKYFFYSNSYLRQVTVFTYNQFQYANFFQMSSSLDFIYLKPKASLKGNQIQISSSNIVNNNFEKRKNFLSKYVTQKNTQSHE